MAEPLAPTAPFGDVPRTPRGHLGLLFYEAALAVARATQRRALAAGQPADAPLREFPFLAGYVAAVAERLGAAPDHPALAALLRGAIAAWERSDPGWLPLRALAQQAEPGEAAVRVWLALGLVEEEPGFAALFDTLAGSGAARRPTVGLLRELFAGETALGDIPSACRRLIDAALVRIVNPDAARAEWMLAVPDALWTAAAGELGPSPAPGLRRIAPEELPTLDELVASPEQRQRLAQAVALLAAGRARHLLLRAGPGCARREVAGALARGIGSGLLEVGEGAPPEAARALGPLCALGRCVPVFAPELGPSETFTPPPLPGYAGPVFIFLGVEGGATGLDRPLTVELAPEPPQLRLEQWRRALGPFAGAEVERIARTFTMPGGHIRDCAAIAVSLAAVARRDQVTLEDARLAARALNRQLLDSLAARLEANAGWGELVVDGATAAELRELERRCRQREALAGAVGADFPGGLNPGVRALLEGPSGTGKTLAARVLAHELGLDLYRVDLAAVVNKYVGETEKNLSKVLGRAEELDVVLLLDEGDALMTRRTDVRSANDRYANLETDYLLQRLESYRGIVLVTTNLPAQIDAAFRRRMDLNVRFHLPEADERWQLWQLHLPLEHQLRSELLERVALRYRLTGGQIRNAAIHAMLLSLERRRPLGDDDLLAGIEMEHRKAGAAYTPPEAAPAETGHGALSSFLELIS